MDNKNFSKRSLALQKARLLESNKVNVKKPLYTRGTAHLRADRVLLESRLYKPKNLSNAIFFKSFIISILVASVAIWFINIWVGVLLALLFFIIFCTLKNQNSASLQNKSSIKKYTNLNELIQKSLNVNNDIKDVLEKIKIHYINLLPLIEKKQIEDLEDEYFIVRSLEKHIPDILNNLHLVPENSASETQSLALEQFKNINKKLIEITQKYIVNINKEIKRKSIFTS